MPLRKDRKDNEENEPQRKGDGSQGRLDNSKIVDNHFGRTAYDQESVRDSHEGGEPVGRNAGEFVRHDDSKSGKFSGDRV